jgi:hypothetical protein
MRPDVPAAAARRWALGALMMLALAGCATPTRSFDSRVSVFHRFPVDAPRTYAFAPAAAQRDSLEYRAYQQAMRDALAVAGFTESDRPAWRVGFDWSLLERSALRAQPVIVPSVGFGFGGWPYGGWGGVGMRFGYPFGGWPYGGWPYGGWPAYAAVPERLVEHQLKVEISSAAGGPDARVYEASAIGEANDPAMPQVLPLLAQSIFRGFPGNTGQTRRVRIDLSDAPPAATLPGSGATPAVPGTAAPGTAPRTAPPAR